MSANEHKLRNEYTEDGTDGEDSYENRLRCRLIHCDSVLFDERGDGDRSDLFDSVPIYECAERDNEADRDDPRS